MKKRLYFVLFVLLSLALILSACSDKNDGDVDTVTEYTVSFVSRGEVFDSYKAEEGSTISFPKESPKNYEDDSYVYEFAGWSLTENGELVEAGGKLTGNVTYYAVFNATNKEDLIPKYTVIFVDGLTGETIDTVSVKKGESAEAPKAPVHEGYTFTGWDKDFDNITSRTEVVAEYERNEYTFTIVNLGATVSEKVLYGDAISPGAASTVYGLTFDGWYADENYTVSFDTVAKDGMPAKNVTAYAKYSVDLTGARIEFPEYSVYGGEPVSVYLPRYYDQSYEGDDYENVPEIVEYTYLWDDGSTGEVFDFRGAGAQSVSVTVTATYAYDGGAVVTDITLSDECEVAKATLDVGVSFTQNVITYGVTPAPVFDIKGFVGDDASTQTALIKPVYTSLGVVADAAKLPVGNYIVSVDGSALADYEVTGHLAYLTVNRAPLDVEVVFDKDSYIYGDEVIVSLAYEGFVYDENATDLEFPGSVKHVRGAESNGAYSAGEHAFVGEGCVSDSYDFNYISASKLIAKAPLTVKASTDKAVYVYGEIPVVSHAFTGFVNGETAEVISGDAVYVYTGETSYGLRAAGEHSVTTEGFVSVNYAIDYVKADFTVLKAELTGKVVIVDPDNFVYGDMLRLSLELTGFVGGESLATLGVSPVFTVVAGENVYSPVDKLHAGEYSVNASIDEPANYTVKSIESAPLTIGKKTLTVTLSTDKESYVYGETVTPKVTFTGFVYGENATTAGCVSEIEYYSKDLNLYTEDIFTVGDGYSAYAEGGSTADYKWSSAWTNKFNVVKKTASVTVITNKTEYVYGENVTATLEYSGLVYGETPAEAFGELDIVYVKDGVTLDNVNNPGIGTYTLSASGYREPDNYDLQTYGNEFTITEREFVIRVNAVAASESGWSKSEGFDTLTLDYGPFYVDGTLKLNTTVKGLYRAVGESLSGSEFVWNGNMYIRLGSVGGRDVTANFRITYDISVNLTDKSFEGVNISIKNNNLVYTGFAQSLGSVSADNATTSAVNVTYSLAESGEYASSAPTAVNAGNYTVYYRVTAVGYEGTVEGSYIAVVAPAVNRIEKISDGNYVYNGESQTVDIAKLVRADFGVPEVTDGSNVFTAVPAGGYLVFTVSVAETSNYSSAEYELSVPIAKAEIALNANDVSAKYDGSAFGADVVLTVEGAYEDEAEFSYEYSYGGNVQTSPFTFVNAGAYSVTVRVTSANYAEVTATYTVTIAKGDYEVVVSEETFTYTGVAQGNDVTVTGSDPYTVDYYYNGVLYTGEGAPAYVDAGTYAIRCIVKAGTANYNDCEVTYDIVIAMAQNAVSRIDGKDFTDYVYNGEWQTVDYASVLKADFGTLIVMSGNASFLNVPSGGVHTFTVGVAGNSNYSACSYEVAVNVAKANYSPDEIPVDAVKSEDIVMRLGRTLAFVELNAGFSWADPDVELASGSYSAFYCGDSVNYNVYEVTVEVVARKESVMLSVSENIEADYGVTRLDGLVSVTATGEGRTLTDDEAALVYTISTNADYTVGGTYTVSYVLNENDYYEVRFDGRAGSKFVTSFKIRSVKVGSVSYTIEDALFAASGGTVIVTADTAFATASVKEAVGGLYANTAYYTVKSGVTLLVPYDINYSTDTNTTTEDDAFAAVKVDNAFSKLILTAGNTLTVNGKLIVNAKRNATTSTTSTVNGANYGEMEIAKGAAVILASGSVYESIGFTYGAGEIVAKSGSNVYEPLNMLNWKGGTIASNIKDDVFPLNQFTASSIVAKMRVEYGANYYLKATINISYFGVQRTDVKFVSTGTDALLQLSESSSYIYKYIDESNGEFNLELHGAIRFYNLSVTIRLTVITQTVSTSGKDIPLPGNIKVTIASGTTTVPNGISVKLLPGAEIEVKEGATLAIQSGGKLYGYGEGCATFDSGLTAWRDGALLDRGYPYNYTGAYRVKPVMDFNATTPAVVLVAGTLNAESGSTLAAGIEGVNGGKLTVGASVGVSGTIKEDNSPIRGEAYFYSTITGKLISENSSANLSAGRTYNYIDGVWA